MTGDSRVAPLIDAASAPYRAAGRFAWHFARGKLARDPAFAAILARGLLGQSVRVLDLGCGQGLLAAWLLAAHSAHLEGRWPVGWPAPPAASEVTGIEVNPSEVARARAALGERARFVEGDIRHVDYGPADAVVILDVLHYMSYDSQQAVLHRTRAALAPGGRVLLRIGDAAAGAGFALSTLIDRAVALARRGRWLKLYCRPAVEWQALLKDLGFATEALPLSEGTPFANVLIVGRLK